MASDCEQLARELALLRAEVARLRPVDENRIIQATRSAIQPDIATAVAAGGTVVINKLQPQINSGIEKAREALAKTFKIETVANNAQTEALNTTNETLRAKRDAADAMNVARRAQSTADVAERTGQGATRSAGEAKSIGNNAFDKAKFAEQKAALLEAQTTRASANAKTAKDIAEIARRESDLAKGLANQAKGTAGTAISNAAKASKEAIEASGAVSGLKGVVNGIGSKINAFGNAIAKVETVVGNALVRAAEAVGISKNALAATGRLASQVLQIFNVISTIFVLLEGLAVLEVLGARIDALENSVLSLGAELSGILGRLLGLRDRVARNEASISSVLSVAYDARTIGLRGVSLAQSAQITASGASSTAQVAQSTASQAKLTADGAVRNARQANDNATTAFAKANEATVIANQTTTKANEATRAANNAQGRAGEAFNKALEALGVALTALSLYQAFKGLRGLQGLPGRDGRNGVDGRPGINGVTTVIQLPGQRGERGFPGISGLPGRRGEQGIPGLNGKDGRDGIDVNPGDLAGLKAFIAAQHTQTRGQVGVEGSATRANSNVQHVVTRADVNATTTGLVGTLTAFVTSQFASLAASVTIIGTRLLGFINWAVIDRVMNIMILASTIHNAAMLSNDIGQTLLGAINNVLSVIGIKNSEGEGFDVGAIIGKTFESMIKSIIGEENYTTLTINWQLANRIYQSTTNVFNSLTNAVAVITNALEVIGGTTSKLANALRTFGVVGEKAYQFFNPQPNFHNKFFSFLQNAQQGASTVQMVTQIPVDIVQAKVQIDEALTEQKAALKGDKNPDGTEREKGIEIEDNAPLKAQFEASFSASQGFEVIIEEIFDAGE
ncbi:MAG: hypothetical protein RM347_009085 [Nostoc sp. ChiQUE02]|uniref:hypothetical protein n=1 Tax=Nostoc sp. ChiQUE02 TaxID=3075377 RepID=UPI002AD206CC|nr:hypothetical protein [Nostoc sp. ChiQUE02]MDZ8232897.1 hypothetical protein [Nostoc sp. ChiQUE02]